MLKFMDFPREVRDMIYAEALVSNQVLIAKGECGGYPNNEYGSDDNFQYFDPTLALLQVSKTINSEATLIFFGINTFKLSPLLGLGRPSVFTKYAPLFRSVVVELCNEYYDKCWWGEAFDLSIHENPILVRPNPGTRLYGKYTVSRIERP